jgi:hypothetical protein
MPFMTPENYGEVLSNVTNFTRYYKVVMQMMEKLSDRSAKSTDANSLPMLK